MVCVSSFTEFYFNKYMHQTPMTHARNMPSEEFYFANSEHSVSSVVHPNYAVGIIIQWIFIFILFFHFHLHISTLFKAPVGHWLTGRL